jgi:hypothetical protein
MTRARTFTILTALLLFLTGLSPPALTGGIKVRSAKPGNVVEGTTAAWYSGNERPTLDGNWTLRDTISISFTAVLNPAKNVKLDIETGTRYTVDGHCEAHIYVNDTYYNIRVSAYHKGFVVTIPSYLLLSILEHGGTLFVFN